MDLVADTTFLIDLWRTGPRGAAGRFAAEHRDAAIAIPWVVKGEFLAGARRAHHSPGQVAGLVDRFLTVHSDDGIVAIYATIEADLRERNAWIGSADAWIAATARFMGRPLLTRNATQFSRVAGLEVVSYEPPAAG